MNRARRHAVRGPQGVTMIDVLVSLSVIGVLAAVIVPAVQGLRESARCLQCRNHLRQLATASQQHVSLWNGEFPYTAAHGAGPEGGDLLHSVSPHTRLLMFLDQRVVAERMSSALLRHNDIQFPPRFGDAVLSDLASTRVVVFLCPSDDSRPGATNYRANRGFGPGTYGPDPPARSGFIGNVSGAFVHGRSTRVSEFDDGLSNTALFAEKLIGDGIPAAFARDRDFVFSTAASMRTPDDAVQNCGMPLPERPRHASYGGWTWLYGGWNTTWYNHVFPPNARIPDCSQGGFAMSGGGPGAYTARSGHAGGVNMAFADGSARFISDHIDQAAWTAMSSRSSQER